MSVIYLLIVVSIIVAFCFLAAFLWAVKDGQYEDDVSPAVRMLFDDEVLDYRTTNQTKTTPKMTTESKN